MYRVEWMGFTESNNLGYRGIMDDGFTGRTGGYKKTPPSPYILSLLLHAMLCICSGCNVPLYR